MPNKSTATRNMTLEYDRETERLLEDLKVFFGVKTKAEAIRRSLAVVRTASRYAGDDRTLTLSEPGTNDKVKLSF